MKTGKIDMDEIKRLLNARADSARVTPPLKTVKVEDMEAYRAMKILRNYVYKRTGETHDA